MTRPWGPRRAHCGTTGAPDTRSSPSRVLTVWCNRNSRLATSSLACKTSGDTPGSEDGDRHTGTRPSKWRDQDVKEKTCRQSDGDRPRDTGEWDPRTRRKGREPWKGTSGVLGGGRENQETSRTLFSFGSWVNHGSRTSRESIVDIFLNHTLCVDQLHTESVNQRHMDPVHWVRHLRSQRRRHLALISLLWGQDSTEIPFTLLPRFPEVGRIVHVEPNPIIEVGVYFGVMGYGVIIMINIVWFNKSLTIDDKRNPMVPSFHSQESTEGPPTHTPRKTSLVWVRVK